MKVYYLDIDSGERDPVLYPDPNDYVVELKQPIYDVSDITVEAAQIPATQHLVHERNKTFDLDVVTPTAVDFGSHRVNLQANTFSDGATLAAHVNDRLLAAGATSVNAQWKSATNSLKFSNVAGITTNFVLKFNTGIHGWSSNVEGYTTPNQVFGLTSADQESTNGVLELDGRVDVTKGAKAFVLQLSSGAEEFNKEVYVTSPFYTATVMNTADVGDVLTFSGKDYDVKHEFLKGAQKKITSLRVKFFYKENNKLIPYDFRGRDHTVKLKITCSTDRLANLPKVPLKDFHEPLAEDRSATVGEAEAEKAVLSPYRWENILQILMILIFGVLLIVFIGQLRR